MTDHHEDRTAKVRSEAEKAEADRKKIVHNEQTKYLAASVDRLATTCFFGGLVSPAISLTFEAVTFIESVTREDKPKPAPDHDVMLWLQAGLMFVGVGIILHLTGLIILKRMK